MLVKGPQLDVRGLHWSDNDIIDPFVTDVTMEKRSQGRLTKT